MIDAGLDGRTAIVTGVNNARGIGAAVAPALAAQGVAVFATYLRASGDSGALREAANGTAGEALYRHLSTLSASEVVERVRHAGGRVDAVEVDLDDAAAPRQLFDRAEELFGPVSILVNNAAVSLADSLLPDEIAGGAPSAGGIPIGAFDPERHDRHFHVNVRAPALLMRELARRLIERNTAWGRIISVSTDGASGFATEVSYGASKHALESVTRAAAAELGRYGITANIVALGPIQTGYIPPEAEPRIVAGTPLRRLGEPDDVADVVTFLASHQARWLTGQLLYVGGGHAMSD